MDIYQVAAIYAGLYRRCMYTLDPTTDAIPWTSRSYSRKRKPLSDQSMVVSAKRILVKETGERNKVIDGKKGIAYGHDMEC